MKGEKLYKEIGLIDETLIEASENYSVHKKKFFVAPKWVACVLGLMILSSGSTVLLAREYYENKSTELYMRYLTKEDMELTTAYEYDADKFLRALKSDNNEYIYIAINRLVECFNDAKLREKALKEITPFIANGNEKIAQAAVFAVDILSEKYESPWVYKLSDGSKMFTLFNNYSDYGSGNVLWRIKDGTLEEYFSFSKPSIYIKEIIPSPDHKRLAIATCSNKSEFVQIIGVEEGKISPELVESARVKYAAEKGLTTWIRTDYENYSYIRSIAWKNDDILEVETTFTYDDTSDNIEVKVTYEFSEKQMHIK